MHRLHVPILALVLAMAGSAVVFPATQTDSKAEVALPAGTLTAAQLHPLFTDKTVYSVTAVQGRRSVSYYAPNGEVRQLRNNVKRTGRWRVTESGRICLQMEDLPEKCRIIVEEQGMYNKYIVKKNGTHQLSIHYTSFVQGNPLGL